jgi:hypothetical protein
MERYFRIYVRSQNCKEGLNLPFFTIEFQPKVRINNQQIMYQYPVAL